jgi:gliding motility-associated-like protein
LTATDSFGLTRSDEALYESVHVKAEFEILTQDEETGEWAEQENPSGEAPLSVRFRNLTENGTEYLWVLVDSAKTGATGDTMTFSLEDSIELTYYYPGYYFPKLYGWGEPGIGIGCVDSFPLVNPIEIYVEPSELDVPNVFTPNNDGVNDFFQVNSRSLKNFRIIIYNRNGRKVYEHEQTEEKFEWEGWDGTIFGKGKQFAQPGVYFYVIEALGWDAIRYRRNEPFTGFVYLYREKE